MMAPTRLFELKAEGIRVELDLDVGHIARFEATTGGRVVAPFHRAPWADDPTPPDGVDGAPHLRRLSIDFFCAPFGASDVEPSPAHGWTANASWTPVSVASNSHGVVARFVLEKPVMGATVIKELSLRDGHPFLYQRHRFIGGAGAVSVANHTMVRLPNGGEISFSPKRWAETPDAPVESDPARGVSVFAYPARSSELGAFPLAGGGAADLRHYPIAERHEDFVMLVESPGSPLGWTAAVRRGEADAALFLKNPASLPVTMLWYSNAGRFYPPWSGRHADVLGVEDARAWSLYGHAASVASNPLSALGVATALALSPEGEVGVSHVFGAVPINSGEDAGGERMEVPFDAEFLQLGS
jgi:hypothetical protein